MFIGKFNLSKLEFLFGELVMGIVVNALVDGVRFPYLLS